MHPSNFYEPGMKITHEAATRGVTLTFRGRVIALPGQFATELEGIRAGERYCTGLGWRLPLPSSSHSMLTRRAIRII